jgi:hypothetical protein
MVIHRAPRTGTRRGFLARIAGLLAAAAAARGRDRVEGGKSPAGPSEPRDREAVPDREAEFWRPAPLAPDRPEAFDKEDRRMT